MMLTLGTGVGGGVVIGGMIFRGAHGLGAELGHFTLNPDGPPCPGNCPNRGCLEAYCSGQALERDATELARDKPGSRPGRLHRRGREGVAAASWWSAAEGGDPDALLMFDNFARMLGVAIAGYVNVFEPERLAIGGGLSRASHLFLDRAVQEAAARALPALWRRTTDRAGRGRRRRRGDRRRRAGGPGGERRSELCAILHARTPQRSKGPNDDQRPPQLDELAHQHDPHALDGRGGEGELRPSRRADGARAAGLPALHARDEAQPGQRRLVRPRPLRALGRPRLDAALLEPLPVRLRAHARRPEELPPARQPHRRAPRARRRRRDRGHHRAARPGHLHGGGPGARRGDARRPLQPRPATS